MIEPSNGRIVWYTPYNTEMEGAFGMAVQRDKDGKVIPLTAQICAVWGPRMVNLVVTDANGKQYAITSRSLLQDGDEPNPYGGYAQWMPYQKGQAAKHDAEKAAG
jgi:hypothetical protein